MAIGAPLHGQQKFTLSGRVIDASTGAAISIAWIELAGTDQRLRTDAEGSFRLDLAGGRYSLIVRALGYGTATADMELRADSTLTIALQLRPLQLQRIEVRIDQPRRRTRPLPWSVRTVPRDQLVVSPAASPVDVLKQRSLITLPCSQSGGECVRYRNGLIEPLVCIDERTAAGGLAELRTWPSASLYRIEVHDGGRMIRVYTTWFMEQVQAGRMAPRAVPRNDTPQC